MLNAYTNYKRTIEMANELEETAKELTSIAKQDFTGIMTRLGVSWKGENAERYIRKCSSVKKEMFETAKQISAIAAEVRAAAAKMKAEQEAQQSIVGTLKDINFGNLQPGGGGGGGSR